MRTEEHFIWTGDYATRLSRLHAAAEAARDDKTPLLAGEEHPYDELAKEYEALKAEADEAGLRLILRGLRDDEWDDLVDAHPQRTEGPHAEGDKYLGLNERTALRPLLYAGLVEPRFDSRSRFDDWVAEQNLTRGDLNAAALKVWAMTNGSALQDPQLLSPLPTRVDGES